MAPPKRGKLKSAKVHDKVVVTQDQSTDDSNQLEPKKGKRWTSPKMWTTLKATC